MKELDKETLDALTKLSLDDLAQVVNSLKPSAPTRSVRNLAKIYEIQVICTCRLCGSIHKHKATSASPKNIEHRAPTCGACINELMSWERGRLVDKLIDIASLGDPTIRSIQLARPAPIYEAPEERAYIEHISLELVEHDKELIELIDEVAAEVIIEESEEIS